MSVNPMLKNSHVNVTSLLLKTLEERNDSAYILYFILPCSLEVVFMYVVFSPPHSVYLVSVSATERKHKSVRAKSKRARAQAASILPLTAPADIGFGLYEI